VLTKDKVTQYRQIGSQLQTKNYEVSGSLNFYLLLLISVDGLVAPGISSSSNIPVYKLATCWLEPPKYRHIL